MNTKSINNLISRELGLKKSTVNEEGIYVGDFHCTKEYGTSYSISIDSDLSVEMKKSIVSLLKNKGCRCIDDNDVFSSRIYFMAFMTKEQKRNIWFKIAGSYMKNGCMLYRNESEWRIATDFGDMKLCDGKIKVCSAKEMAEPFVVYNSNCKENKYV